MKPLTHSFGRDKIFYIAQFVAYSKKHPEEHTVNKEKLFRNLEESSRQHLEAICARLERFADKKINSYHELYNAEEMREFDLFNEFTKSINDENMYFTYSHFRLPCNNFEASVFLYRHGIDRLKTLSSLGTKAIIDVGGFIADSVLVFRDAFPQNPLYSFEPNNENYRIACVTVKINNINGWVIIENTALGDQSGEAIISTTADAGARILHADSPGQHCKMDTLDNYVARNNIKVGLIKVDVEGYEMNFLRGAIETIKTQKPVLLLSIYHSYNDFYNIKPFIEELNLGYTFDFFKGIDNQVWADIMLLCEAR